MWNGGAKGNPGPSYITWDQPPQDESSKIEEEWTGEDPKDTILKCPDVGHLGKHKFETQKDQLIKSSKESKLMRKS